MKVEFEPNTLDFGPALRITAETPREAFDLGHLAAVFKTLPARYTSNQSDDSVWIRIPTVSGHGWHPEAPKCQSQQ